MELLPKPISVASVSEEEIEDLPGIEFNAKLIPVLLKGRIDKLYNTITKQGTVKIHGLPKFAEWFGQNLDLSNFAPLALLFNRKAIERIRKQLVLVLDQAMQNLNSLN